MKRVKSDWYYRVCTLQGSLQVSSFEPRIARPRSEAAYRSLVIFHITPVKKIAPVDSPSLSPSTAVLEHVTNAVSLWLGRYTSFFRRMCRDVKMISKLPNMRKR